MIAQSISVLMLFLIISHGIYQQLIFKILQLSYQKDSFEKIEKGIDEEDLVLLKFSQKDLNNGIPGFKWIKKNEFRFQKEMYDIVMKEINGDSVYFYCYHDEKESVLYGAIEKIYKGLFKDKSDKSIAVINFLSFFYSKPLETKYNIHFNVNGNSLQNLPSNILEGEHFLESPPPRC